MIFNEKFFGGERPARTQAYRLPRAAPIPPAASPAAAGTRLPAGIALAIMTMLALGLWCLIIFVFWAVIFG